MQQKMKLGLSANASLCPSPRHFYSVQWLWVLMVSTLTLSSCHLFKPVPKKERQADEELGEIVGKRIWNPETQSWEPVREVSGPMDTLKWTQLPPEAYPPILSTPEVRRRAGQSLPEDTEVKDRYRVALLLPFMTHRNNPEQIKIYKHSYWALHFYAGAQLAVEDLQQTEQGAPLDLYVLDTKAATQHTRQLLASNPDLAKADLIIGPYRAQNVRLAAKFGNAQGKVVVAPWAAMPGLTENNEYFVQANPSLQRHCSALIWHALESRTDSSEIVVVVRDDPVELHLLPIFREAAWEFAGTRDTVMFQEFVVKDTTSDYHQFKIGPMIAPKGQTIFIVPSWSDEKFVYELLRQLLIAQQYTGDPLNPIAQDREVVVYGMPQWADFERIDLDFYEKLHVRISTPFYIDKGKEAVRQFRQRYFERFGTLPTQAAYLGYDITYYFCKQLLQFGTRFQKVLDAHPWEGLHMRFEVEPVPATPLPNMETLERVDRYENSALYLLQFKEYHFQPIAQ